MHVLFSLSNFRKYLFIHSQYLYFIFFSFLFINLSKIINLINLDSDQINLLNIKKGRELSIKFKCKNSYFNI